MNATMAQPATPINDERRLWLPPTRLRQYVRARLLGAVGMAAIFAFWLVLQWSNPTMRYASAVLIGVTAWITWVSIASDIRRSRSRQVEVLGDRESEARESEASAGCHGQAESAELARVQVDQDTRVSSAEPALTHGSPLALPAGPYLRVTTPAGVSLFRIADVKDAQWREDTDAAAGLWFYDENGRTLAHLDLNYIGDQDEARSFLRWLRQRAEVTFDVRWPAT